MSLVVRVVAPTGRDARLITEVLRQNGLAAEACSDLLSLLDSVGETSIGPLLIAEEALAPLPFRSCTSWLSTSRIGRTYPSSS